jgi:chromosome segregation protein
MRLKQLEMIGFKSFAQKTLIEFNPGITAIVGPNGCGKSNIVDALRWAMGEQSAKHLRGHQMEDVIFNGSDSLPSTGMAEVSLTFDNQDGRGPVDYNSFSEITVTRRLFRSGESEYSINKVACRLKDVVEFFLGTGVGSKAYSIVEQGRVDELVNSKPEDRRALIEEAAGTSKYKSRKLVAERKLERTQQNLLRVNDIVREIERQVRTMEQQARKAERYRALKFELREKDLAWAAVQRETLKSQISHYEAQFADAETRYGQYLTSLCSKESESETVRLSLMEAEKQISGQQENVYQIKIQIQTGEQKLEFDRKDLAQLAQTETEIRAALLQLDDKLKNLSREIDELNKAKESFVELSLFEAAFLHEKEAELATLEAQLQSLQSALDRGKGSLIETTNEISQLRNTLLAAEKRSEEVGRDLVRSREEHSGAVSSLELCGQNRKETQRALELCMHQARERGLESAQLFASNQALNKAKEEQQITVETLKEQMQETRSRLISFEDLQKNYEGYQAGVRAIMMKKQQEAPNGIYGLVAEVIEAPETYERALTAVLGDRLQYVIVKGHEEGVEAIEYLKREAYGRGSFIPLELSRKNSRPLPLGEVEVIAPLLDMISVREGFRDVAEYLLSGVVIVKDLQAGLALWHRNGFYSTLVTLEGEVIDPMGVVTGGSDHLLEGNFLTQRRRIKELRCSLADMDGQLKLEEQAVGRLNLQLEQAETKRSHLSAEIHRLDLERVRLEHEQRAADQEFERLTRTAQVLEQEQNDLATALQFRAEEISQSRTLSEAYSREKAELERSLTDKQAMFQDLKKSKESVHAAVTQSRIRNAALSEKKENTDYNLRNRLELQEETTAQIRSRHDQIIDIQRHRVEIENSLARGEKALEAGKLNLIELEARLESERRNYRHISANLAEIEESIKELRRSTDTCQEEKNRLRLLLSEKKLNLQHLAETVREKYDAVLEHLALEVSTTTRCNEDFIAEIDELRGRLERMGEVNLTAIGEYEELTTRAQFMSRQKEDLEKSIADLQQAIVKLNRICRLRFRESFNEINDKFQSIFPRLFRGGKANLVLTDENDYLETGVDIIVQPPGKKLQSITLLSGGEKALTAVSLLFAIFLTKPSPFCFLDEVDAPLDDANIDRFNDLINEMSQISQFVLVTHNKKTMQAAEILYGITMAEPGISKVVSVRMT